MAPTGQAINVTDHKPGSISDLVIFQCNLDFHNQALNKYGEDQYIADTTFVSAKFPENWAVCMDKAYQGALQQVHAIEETTQENTPIGG